MMVASTQLGFETDSLSLPKHGAESKMEVTDL
jgi:hypothetical protein